MPVGGIPQGYKQAGGQSCFDKVKMGFMMGNFLVFLNEISSYFSLEKIYI